MKRKILIINLFLVLTLLFSMVLQSLDSFNHFEKLVTEKECYHSYNSSSEITHQHHNFDHCYVCQFEFSSSVVPQDFTFQIHTALKEIPYSFSKKTFFISFSGSLYSLRGPPNVFKES